MKISYLTWLHEKIGTDIETITLPSTIDTVEGLIVHLESKGANYAEVFKNRHIIYTAVNDELAHADTAITDSDNISFFSAIAGG